MAATERQKRYIYALLAEGGYINPRYRSFYGCAKALPYGPTMRQRGVSGGVDSWLEQLTIRQASEVIDWLKKRVEA